MDNNWRKNKLRGFGAYLPKILKFYDLKNEFLTPVIFIIILGVTFFSHLKYLSYVDEVFPLLQSGQIEDLEKALPQAMQVNVIFLLSSLFLNIISAIYLIAYIKQLKGQSFTVGECVGIIARNLFKIIIALLIYAVLMAVGLFLLVIPMLIVFLMFFFTNCYLLDKDMSVFASLKASRRITQGYKMKMLMIMITFYVLFFIIPSFFIAASSPIIAAFISSFISTIVSLMYQRLTALMYIDLEYSPNHENFENMI